MRIRRPKYPFEATFAELQADPDSFVSVMFSTLESEFLVLPKGAGFVDYPVFEHAYEALKKATDGFEGMQAEVVLETVLSAPLALVVLRTMLGFTPPEFAYLASQHSDVVVSQGFARSLDRKIRIAPLERIRPTAEGTRRLKQLVITACRLLTKPIQQPNRDKLHRLDKADTRNGIEGVRSLAQLGAPYAMLLYERFLGRPFAGHRDSVSELVGNVLESAIEDTLAKGRISYRKTRRAEKIRGFDQAPDFIIPSEFNPQIVIEAKLTEDDGTARDKVTRVQHLAQLSERNKRKDRRGFEVIACIGGRGFGVRREDMRKLLLATRGKVFTTKILDRLVGCTRLREFATR
ncbi:hypothetical protein L6Q96_21545 [Candidatus Binatia bacterium]|nr:hypothetical protein [Candidatus Binatia bacterium]